MRSLSYKLRMLDSFLFKMESSGDPEISKLAKIMRDYQDYMNLDIGIANFELVEFLDSLDDDKIPQNNGFVKFMVKNSQKYETGE